MVADPPRTHTWTATASDLRDQLAELAAAPGLPAGPPCAACGQVVYRDIGIPLPEPRTPVAMDPAVAARLREELDALRSGPPAGPPCATCGQAVPHCAELSDVGGDPA